MLQARLHYLKDQKPKALKIMETMDTVPLQITAVEDALDRAKALHEVGLTQASKQWFEKIGQHCKTQPTDPYLHTYLLQEQQERAELTTAPRELNNIAVMHYQHGNWQAALTAFEHAFRLLPRNAGIALNLLQSMLTAPTGAIDPVKRSRLQQSCLTRHRSWQTKPRTNTPALNNSKPSSSAGDGSCTFLLPRSLFESTARRTVTEPARP